MTNEIIVGDPVREMTAGYAESPAWVERQRLRRLYEALIIHENTRSEFLLHWAQNELMHIVRDS